MNQNFELKILIMFLISIFVGVSFVFYLQNKAYAATPTCGNGVCEEGENCDIDCGSYPTCGNGVCEPGENCDMDCHCEKRCDDNDVYWYDCNGHRQDKYQDCGDSGWTDEYRCSGNWVQRKWVERGCSSAQCFENYQWEDYEYCKEGKVCQNGTCIAISPSVDLKVKRSDGPISDGPITAHYQDFILLSWTSQNAISCQASGDWSGSKPTSGQESIQLNSVKTYTFTITCYSSSQSVSDSVTVRVLPKPPKVITKPVVSTK